MTTVGYLLIFVALLLGRGAAKGRGFTDTIGDLGDFMTAVLTNDAKGVREVLARGDATLGEKVAVSEITSQIPGTQSSSMYPLGKVDPRLNAIASEVGLKFGIKTIIGWRANNGGYGDESHSEGKAIDIFVSSRNQGDAVAKYLLANRERFDVRYVIWWQRIWYPIKGWSQMADRGSDNANHKNHVHLTIN